MADPHRPHDPHRTPHPLEPVHPADEAPDAGVVIRDLIIFHMKLAMDGLKDVVLAPLSIGAVALDLVLKRRGDKSLFYAVLRAGEKYDLWLNLYGAATEATHRRSGLLRERDALPRPPIDIAAREHARREPALPAPADADGDVEDPLGGRRVP